MGIQFLDNADPILRLVQPNGFRSRNNTMIARHLHRRTASAVRGPCSMSLLP